MNLKRLALRIPSPRSPIICQSDEVENCKATILIETAEQKFFRGAISESAKKFLFTDMGS